MNLARKDRCDLPWWDIRAYDYELPRELVAQKPAAERDASRLLVYSCSTRTIRHHIFRDLPQLLRPDDVLVVNDCRVIPARLYVRRVDTGREIELLLCERLAGTRWAACVRPGRGTRVGTRLEVGGVSVVVQAVREDGLREIEFECTESGVEALLEQYGRTPLPPYVKRDGEITTAEDRERYQTVYAARGMAVAAPTAGLHFTPGLMKELEARGCEILAVTLEVGLGTFQPVKGTDAREHRLHAEHAVVTPAVAARLNAARREGRRIVAVGTTVVRTLESSLDTEGKFGAFDGATRLFIHPPYQIRAVDALITNFHLPRSTLLMLLAAFIGPVWRELYAEAIRRGYRFYSYGDAMLVEK
ncbi:MAG: tRNA preQ1(34) S-adenosylmethionine ribosyltransferase-isomerase QueA [bacterium]|nr:tRNA preQ1(34) S-adenosylmethionine ribosyltransferase-isomerase QueA [bacterium]